MRLIINAETAIKDLRKEFSLSYPFLKLEFFQNDNKTKTRHTVLSTVDHHKLLGEIWDQKKAEGVIEVTDNITVMELENLFMEEFGLAVQVFRKSGNIWLQTTMTDGLTLKQQNDHGEEISTGYKDEMKNIAG